VLDQWINQRWISKSWNALGGGPVCWIKLVDVHRIARYLSKYLTDDLVHKVPAGLRRITTSRNIHLLEKPPKKGTWRLDRRSIFHLFKLFRSVAYQIQEDQQGFLFCFFVPAGVEIPPWKDGP
jgi:hypothetical protein